MLAIAVSKKIFIVNWLNTIPNFGAMNILYTNRTEVLIHDKIILQHYLDKEDRGGN
ncbi:magnesium ion-transporting ATPase E1-E2 family protein [Xenorhabdus vietnamensis]|uniref:Magnesium ion-transporting ATPase E1-E2 family protein n=1 Tax=Xenorhabdus vietnamensis TaxID=351656 RepID=A0A1Y2SHI7_9GAMM|nr:magnesium ion-transporting ATPase E1-E2 family protein [Xenorhabdus vietnamensis]